jgi:hypothetical protein
VPAGAAGGRRLQHRAAERGARIVHPGLYTPAPVPASDSAPPPSGAWRPRTSSGAQPIAEALSASSPLARLGERLRESTAMLESVRPLLPAPLAAHVRAGPVDPTGWSILVGHAAAAAKLRQLVPHLETRLADRGHAVTTVRIKVLPG